MKKIMIKGRVIGVFFRKFVCDNAVKLDLKGYVKNIGKNVEVIVKGVKVNELIKLCRKGPPGARVDEIIIEDFPNQEFKVFEIRY